MARGYAGSKLARSALAKKLAQPLAPPEGKSARYYELWNSVVGDFEPTYFKESDRGTLESYITTREQIEQVDAQLEREGFTMVNANGSDVEHPLMKISDKLHRRSLTLARSMNITPSSRLQTVQASLKDSEHLRKQLDEAKAEDDQSHGLALVG